MQHTFAWERPPSINGDQITRLVSIDHLSSTNTLPVFLTFWFCATLTASSLGLLVSSSLFLRELSAIWKPYYKSKTG
jgi:hypothetical protein